MGCWHPSCHYLSTLLAERAIILNIWYWKKSSYYGTGVNWWLYITIYESDFHKSCLIFSCIDHFTEWFHFAFNLYFLPPRPVFAPEIKIDYEQFISALGVFLTSFSLFPFYRQLAFCRSFPRGFVILIFSLRILKSK